MAEADDSLILLHLIFRHGDRTPDKEHMYPKDIHIKEEFHPYGSGQLTQDGKVTMYDLGEHLRQRYNKFLGKKYVPHEIDALCTDMDRTKMSLQLVLASLFPPKDDQVLKANLNWQPIPIKFVPFKDDKMFAVVSNSKDFLRTYLENYQIEKQKEYVKKFDEFLKYFEANTGLKDVAPRHVWVTLGVLATERECGFETPSWATSVFHQLMEFAQLEYQMQTATNELKRLIAGELFTKILKDTKLKIDKVSKYKVHLYSCHDYNVANILTILGLMYPHFPRYAACIALEVHQVDDKIGFKVFYRENKTSPLTLLLFPNGNETMSFEDFEKLVSEFTLIAGHL